MQGFCSQGNFCKERIWLSWWLLQREDLALMAAFAKRILLSRRLLQREDLTLKLAFAKRGFGSHGGFCKERIWLSWWLLQRGFDSQAGFCKERIWLSSRLLQKEDLALKPAFAKRGFVPLRQERIWLSRVRFGSQAVIYLLLSYSFPFFWDSFSFFMPGHFSISHFTLPFYLSYFLPLHPLNHNS